MKKNKFFSILLISFSLIFLASCSDDDNNVVAPTESTTNLRVIHTSYDAPSVDISVNGNVAIPNLGYGESSGYAQLPTSTNLNVNVTPAGTSNPIVINANVTLEDNKDYTVFAVNDLSSIQPLVVVDDRTPNASKVKLRFLHASPDAPAVDIKLTSGTGTPLIEGIGFANITDYLEVDGGTYDLAVTPTGSTTEVVLLKGIELTNGSVYTVVAHGTLNSNDQYPFAIRAFVDNDSGQLFADLNPALSNVKVVHASPDAPGVDLLVDNAVTGTNLMFPGNTGYLEILSGTRNVKVNVTGTQTTVVEADLMLNSNQFYSIYAVNSVNQIEPLVIQDDLTLPSDGKAHVRFLHLSPDAPAVDITTTDGSVVFGNQEFKDYTSFTPLDAGVYDLQVRLAGTSTVVLDLSGIVLENGKIYSVFAKGFVSGTGDQALGAQIITAN